MVKIKCKLSNNVQTLFLTADDFYDYIHSEKLNFRLGGKAFKYCNDFDNGRRFENAIRNEQTYIIHNGKCVRVKILDRGY